jgi:hypothetical protein
MEILPHPSVDFLVTAIMMLIALVLIDACLTK